MSVRIQLVRLIRALRHGKTRQHVSCVQIPRRLEATDWRTEPDITDFMPPGPVTDRHTATDLEGGRYTNGEKVGYILVRITRIRTWMFQRPPRDLYIYIFQRIENKMEGICCGLFASISEHRMAVVRSLHLTISDDDVRSTERLGQAELSRFHRLLCWSQKGPTKPATLDFQFAYIIFFRL